jgi:hypothetical protein
MKEVGEDPPRRFWVKWWHAFRDERRMFIAKTFARTFRPRS